MKITSQKTYTRHNTVQGVCQFLLSGSHTLWRFIPLTQGKFAIVDAEDFDWLSNYKWRAIWSKFTKSFYAIRYEKKNGHTTTIYMAREILGLKYGDKRQADHIDHVTLDNRRSNLRTVTSQQNHFNQRKTKGYRYHKLGKKYQARIGLNCKQIHLGLFRTAKDAHNAYLEAKKLYHKF